MKIPQTPPSWLERLPKLIQDDNLFKDWILSQKPLPRDDEYLHWDKIRYLEPPEGLTNEDWWTILKYRRNNRTHLTLMDKQGMPFHFFLTQQMFQLLHDVDLKAGGSISSLEEVTNPETRDRYYVSSLMEESVASSLLEGAATTRSEAKDFLRSGKKAVTEAQRMVVNNYRTMQHLAEWKNEPLSVERLLEMHQAITEGTLDDPEQEGRFRTPEERIDIGSDFYDRSYHVPPDASELPSRIQAMCDFANDTEMKGFLHPVIRSIILHFWLAYDHPFVDGNGRTARTLFYWCMLRNDFWLVEFISISRLLNAAPAQYYKSFLHTETDENDLNYFILHQLKVICRSIENLHQYLEQKRKEITDSRNLSGPQSGMNHRQIALVQKAIREPGFTFTIKSHQTSHNVVYQTARTDLKDLADRGILDEVQVKNKLVYVAPDDITDRLKSLS